MVLAPKGVKEPSSSSLSASDEKAAVPHNSKHWPDLIRRACFNSWTHGGASTTADRKGESYSVAEKDREISTPRSLDEEVEDCVRALRVPSVRTYSELRRKLSSAGNSRGARGEEATNQVQGGWIAAFLRHGGLTVLLDSLPKLCERGYGRFSDALVQLECVHCVRAVMDSRIGLDHIVENGEYTLKLAAALNTTNVTVKKQVFELLSALCVYSKEGYKRALQALEHYKESRDRKYRFDLVVDEVRQAKNVEYQTALVAFVNCIIISAPSPKERSRIRNEFIALKFLDLVGQLRRELQNNSTDTDLSVQLDVFEEQRYTDEAQLTGPDGVDLNSHLDVFYAILRQVATTPREIPFLSILQHLLRVDGSKPLADVVWDTAETLVHRATLLESKEDSKKLLLRSSTAKLRSQQPCQCSCHKSADERQRRRTVVRLNSADISQLTTPSTAASMTSCNPLSAAIRDQQPDFNQPSQMAPAIPPPPPPPPPPPMMMSPPANLPPPPPPPPLPPHGIGPPGPPPPPLPPPNLSNIPNFNPSFMGSSMSDGFTSGSESFPSLPRNSTRAQPAILLPQQETPRPKNKMKTLNWNKIPVQSVLGKNNIWSLVAKAHDGSPNDLDFDAMEGLFCQVTGAPPGSAQASPRLPRKESKTDSLDRKKKDYVEINLLDGKRSLNVNIFLKQFRSTNDEIIEILRKGLHDEIGAEKLRGLLNILPEADEVELLRGYDGDRYRLGNAEKFLLQLVQLSQYKLRIEAMLLKEEFSSNMAFLEPAIESITAATNELRCCETLREVMYLVLVAGNFLNSGGYAGNAAGFKIMSLLKLTDIRANKPGINLIHYVAWQAEMKYPLLLKFFEELPTLEEASKLSIENLKSDFTSLNQRVTKISKQVNDACAKDIQLQMNQFLKMAESQLIDTEKELNALEKERRDLAEFLCEDASAFKLEECFRVFHGFCQKFRQALEENERRRQQEIKAEERRRQREDPRFSPLVRKRSGERPASVSGSESETHIIDALLGDIRSGFPQRLHSHDGGSFRVRKVKKTTLESGPELSRMNSLNSSVPSEDEPSLSGSFNSPRVVRRRIGSLTTSADVDNFESPDVTPNGSLRKRRSRVSSEDQDDNLIDYLRQTAEIQEISTGGRDRRSWSSSADGGSLERSLLRRSSNNRRRRTPDQLMIGNDGLYERERSASPCVYQEIPKMVNTEKPEFTAIETSDSSAAVTGKPKQWRRQIEDWLNENERDEDQNRRVSREMRHSRRYLDRNREGFDSSPINEVNESVARSRTNSTTVDSHLAPSVSGQDESDVNNASNVEPIKTDSDLSGPKPKSNIESNLVEPTSAIKDKSRWRKSTLNVANSTESVDEDSRRRSRNRRNGVSTLDVKSNASDVSVHSNGVGSSSQDRSTDDATNHHLQLLKEEVESIEKKSRNLNAPSPLVNQTKNFNTLDKQTKMSEEKVSNLSVAMETDAASRSPKRRNSKDYCEESEPAPPAEERSVRRSLRYNKYLKSNDENAVSPQTTTTQNKNIPVTESGNTKRDEGPFDRFSIIRKTTRLRNRKNVSNTEDSSEEASDLATEKSTDESSKDSRNESRRKSIKNSDVETPTAKQPEVEAKKKTSLRAKLAKRLHSLTENLKSATTTKGPEQNAPSKNIPDVKDKMLVDTDSEDNLANETMPLDPTNDVLDSANTSDVPKAELAPKILVEPKVIRGSFKVTSSPNIQKRSRDDVRVEDTRSLVDAEEPMEGVNFDSKSGSRKRPSVNENLPVRSSPVRASTSSLRGRQTTMIPSPVASRRRPLASALTKELQAVQKKMNDAKIVAATAADNLEDEFTEDIARNIRARKSSIPERIDSRSTSPSAKNRQQQQEREALRRATSSGSGASRSSLRSSKSSLSAGSNEGPKPKTRLSDKSLSSSLRMKESPAGKDARKLNGGISNNLNVEENFLPTKNRTNNLSKASSFTPTGSRTPLVSPISRTISRLPTRENSVSKAAGNGVVNNSATASKFRKNLSSSTTTATTGGGESDNKSLPLRPSNNHPARRSDSLGSTKITPTHSNNPKGAGFGFMRATSASAAKLLPNKPSDEIQKVRIRAMNIGHVPPSRTTPSRTTNISARVGGFH